MHIEVLSSRQVECEMSVLLMDDHEIDRIKEIGALSAVAPVMKTGHLQNSGKMGL
jgi:hypothetical protein